MRPDFLGGAGGLPPAERGAVLGLRPRFRRNGAYCVSRHASVASASADAPCGVEPNAAGG